MAACRALMGSISVTMTLAPKALSDCADPLPTSPYPATQQTLPANMMSVALLIPSVRDSLHPYRLSNLLCANKHSILKNGRRDVLLPRFNIVAKFSPTKLNQTEFLINKGINSYLFNEKALDFSPTKRNLLLILEISHQQEVRSATLFNLACYRIQ